MSKSLNYVRPQTQEFIRRLLEPRRFIQVVAGARQVGKTTLAGQAAFSEAFRPTRKLLVGGDGIDLETFLLKPVENWLKT